MIDGSLSGSVVVFVSNEGPDSVLDGFTLINGSSVYGGGIYCFSSSPTITNTTITGNTAYKGGGISCYHSSSPTITNTTITGNTADCDGGGIWCYYSSPTITPSVKPSSASNAPPSMIRKPFRPEVQ